MSKKYFIVLLVIFSINTELFAQPANDDPCSATPLTVNATCVFSGATNAAATASAGVPAPGCASYLGGDVWFRVTVPANGSLTFDSNTGVITDGGMAIYSGTCGALTLIECDDDDSGNGLMASIAQFGLTPGATIWVRFWDYGNNSNGSFQICVSSPTPPPPVTNSDPCNAIPLTVNANCSFSTYTNAGAGNSVGVPVPGCANYLGGDVWFTAVVPASGSLTFDSNTGIITDGGMAIYSGTCGALSLIECDDDDSGNGLMASIIQNGLTPGITIWIRFWEYGNNNNGSFDICVSSPIPPPSVINIDPCSAYPLTVNASCVMTNYSNAGASNSVGVTAPGCASYAGGDVWFTITVPPSGNVIFDSNNGVITDGGMAIYSGSNCGALTLIECDDDDSANGLMPAITSTGLTPGATIWIRFWEYGNNNNGTFQICVHDVSATPPACPLPTLSANNPICNGGSNGSIVVSTVGDNPFTYTYEQPLGTIIQTNVSNNTSDSLTALSAGMYYVSVLDSSGCFSLDSIELIDPTALVGLFEPTICANNSVLLNGTIYDAGNISGTEVFNTSAGCDSTVTVTISLSLLDTSYIPSFFCTNDLLLAGTIDTVLNTNLLTSAGCDSTVFDLISYFLIDSTFATASSCNPGDTGAVISVDTNSFGCDSFHIITTTLLPSDSTFAIDPSCNPADTGVTMVMDTNSFGCDSSHTIITTLLPTPITNLGIIACDSIQINGITFTSSIIYTDTMFGGASNTCDSIVVYSVIVNSSDSTFAMATSCNPADTGVVLIVDTNLVGCDSTHTIITTLLPSDSTFAMATSCNPVDTGVTMVMDTNSFGCDSSHTIITTLLPTDSTFAAATSCNPIDTGVLILADTNTFGCDSTHTITTTLLPSDSTFASATSCNPGDTGVVILVNTNSFACDSTHTITTTLLPSSFTFAAATSCNPADTGVLVLIEANSLGCDSVHTTTTTLLRSDSTFLFLTTCNPIDAGIVILAETNNLGCDSIHSIITSLLPSANSFTNIAACDSINWIDGNTYVSDILLVDTLIAANGCDSVSTVQITVGSSNTSQVPLQICPNDLPYLLPNGVAVDGSQALVLDTVVNTSGCDSVISYQISYAQAYDVSPDNAIATYGDSVAFTINNQNSNIIFDYSSNAGDDCGSPCNNYILLPTEELNTYIFNIVDTASACTFTDFLIIEISFASELNVPNTFTPNGDGSNDIFRCFGENVDQYNLEIYTRFGGKVFESNQLIEGWDGSFLGQAIESGVYIGFIRATGLDGQKYNITQNIKLVR